MKLSIMECRKCGKSYWYEWPESLAIESGPCCFGHEMLDVEKYPTERAGRKAFPAWQAARVEALRMIWRKYKMHLGANAIGCPQRKVAQGDGDSPIGCPGV